MRTRFEEQLEQIGRRLAAQCGVIDVTIDRGVAAFVQHDSRLAGLVVDGERGLNKSEVELERLCLDTMAMQQPMAGDLRFLAAALKINADVERMGDLASSVAKQTWRISTEPDAQFAQRLRELGESVRSMVVSVVESLIERDADKARVVWLQDDDIDAIYHELVDGVMHLLRDGVVTPDDGACYLAAARALERIGDHAQNIAEDVVFIVEGQIVRHNAEARISPPLPEGV